MRNQQGMTITEVMVGAGLLAIITLGLLRAMGSVHQGQSRTNLAITRDRLIQSLLQSIRANSSQYQMNYSPMDPGTVPATLSSDLPLAWSEAIFTDVANCPGCPGRMGYTIQPLSSNILHGMRLVSIRVFHPDLNGGQPRDFQFVVGER